MALFKVFSKKVLSDEDLIAKYKETKNTAHVGELYQRYTHITLAVCIKYFKNTDDAQDGVMQIFEKLIHDLLKHEIQFFQGWFHTYIRNYCLMQLRKNKTVNTYNDSFKKEILQEDIVETEEASHLNDKEILENNIEKLEAAINQLKNEQKECVRLFFLEERSYKEIEEITGFNYKQVKSYIQNGKRNLRILMEKK